MSKLKLSLLTLLQSQFQGYFVFGTIMCFIAILGGNLENGATLLDLKNRLANKAYGGV